MSWHCRLIVCLRASVPCGVLAHVPAAPLLIQLPSYDLGEQQRMAQGLGCLYPCGRPGKQTSVFQLPISSALAISTVWRVGQWMEDLFVSLKKLPFKNWSLKSICSVLCIFPSSVHLTHSHFIFFLHLLSFFQILISPPKFQYTRGWTASW